MIEHRLFFGFGLAVIIFGVLYSLAVSNYREYEDKLKIDFGESWDENTRL